MIEKDYFSEVKQAKFFLLNKLLNWYLKAIAVLSNKDQFFFQLSRLDFSRISILKIMLKSKENILLAAQNLAQII